jgi:hypothetical protein
MMMIVPRLRAFSTLNVGRFSFQLEKHPSEAMTHYLVYLVVWLIDHDRAANDD